MTTPTNNRYIPDITPPDPYDRNGVLVWQELKAGQIAENDGVLIPVWYLQKLFDYVVDTQVALELARNNLNEK